MFRRFVVAMLVAVSIIETAPLTDAAEREKDRLLREGGPDL